MWKLAFAFCLLTLRLEASTFPITAGFPFSPSSVTVTAGDTIHWTSLTGHDVAETNNSLPGPASYNGTGFLSPCCASSTFDWVASAGDHLYFCTVHGGSIMYGHIFVQTPTPTITDTFTFSPTITDTFTDSPTPTISDTFTIGPSPTISATPTVSPTPSPTPSISPTWSYSPTQSVTATPAAQFLASPLDKVVLGPVPAKAGQPLCLAFPATPISTLLELFNSKGERVAKARFGSEPSQCLDTQGLAPGFYYANIEQLDMEGKPSSTLQKIVIVP